MAKNKVELTGIDTNKLKVLSHDEMVELFTSYKNNFDLLFNKLELLNPLNVLKKGYSVVKKDNHVIKDIKNVKVGDIVNIKINNGSIDAKVEKVDENGKKEI